MSKNEILIELSESDQTKFGKAPFASQSVPQKVFSAIWEVEAEVNNGGFEQYFINGGAETGAAFVVEALNTIGAPKTAEICQKAISIGFPEGLPTDLNLISELAQDFPDEVREELGELDGEFFKYPHNLTELLYAYVSRFPEEFGTLPSDDGT